MFGGTCQAFNLCVAPHRIFEGYRLRIIICRHSNNFFLFITKVEPFLEGCILGKYDTGDQCNDRNGKLSGKQDPGKYARSLYFQGVV